MTITINSSGNPFDDIFGGDDGSITSGGTEIIQ